MSRTARRQGRWLRWRTTAVVPLSSSIRGPGKIPSYPKTGVFSVGEDLHPGVALHGEVVVRDPADHLRRRQRGPW